MLLRDLSSQKKRGLIYRFLSAKEIKDRLADKQLSRAEFERQATRRKDSFDKPITYKSVGHFQEGKKGFVEEDFISAGLRELREETGYVGTEVRLIGVVEPNPAFQNNFCGTILVENARQTHNQDLDSHEEIVVYTRPLSDIPEMIRTRQITHSLVVAAFHHLSLLQT